MPEFNHYPQEVTRDPAARKENRHPQEETPEPIGSAIEEDDLLNKKDVKQFADEFESDTSINTSATILAEIDIRISELEDQLAAAPEDQKHTIQAQIDGKNQLRSSQLGLLEKHIMDAVRKIDQIAAQRLDNDVYGMIAICNELIERAKATVKESESDRLTKADIDQLAEKCGSDRLINSAAKIIAEADSKFNQLKDQLAAAPDDQKPAIQTELNNLSDLMRGQMSALEDQIMGVMRGIDQVAAQRLDNDVYALMALISNLIEKAKNQGNQ